jgi:DNA ligase-4
MLCQRNQRDFESIAKLMRMDRQPNADADAAAAQSIADPHFYTAEQFMIEEKLDGERMQLHMVGDKFMYSSR